MLGPTSAKHDKPIRVNLAPAFASIYSKICRTQGNATSRRLPRRARRGGGITDLLLAAVIAIIILAGLFALFQSVNRSIKDSRLNSMVTRAASVIERAYSNSVNYPTGSLLPSLAVSGVFSDGEITRTGTTFTFNSPYNTDITVVGSGARVQEAAPIPSPSTASPIIRAPIS